METIHLGKANEALIQEYLDIVAHDSENLERTMQLFSDDCVFELEPTGDVYAGKVEIEAFVSVAMSGRTHADQYSIQITNWFTDGEQFCIEYTHGGISTGVYSAGLKVKFRQGIARYCIIYHMKDGQFDRVHEFIQATNFLANLAMPLALKRIRRLADKKISRVQVAGNQAQTKA
jgi:ketosteroid isomerase-like protein